MERKNKYFLYFLIALISSVICAVFRAVLTVTSLDAKYGVYKSGEILPLISHVIIFLFIAILAVFAFRISGKKADSSSPKIGSFTILSASMTAFMIVANTLLSLYNIVVVKMPIDKINLLLLVFSVPTIIYFLSFLKAEQKKTALLAFVSICSTLWFALDLIRIYFDSTLLVVSPGKIIEQLAHLAVMVYMLSETRVILDKSSERLFLISGAAASILLLTSSIPSLIFSDLLYIGASDSFLLDAVQCAMGFFILSRLFAYSAESDVHDSNENIEVTN